MRPGRESGRAGAGGASPAARAGARRLAPSVERRRAACTWRVAASTFSYEEGREAVPAVRDVAFELGAGGSLALLGASGAGKSTLLQLVRGLDEPEAGAVLLDGVEPGGAGYAGPA